MDGLSQPYAQSDHTKPHQSSPSPSPIPFRLWVFAQSIHYDQHIVHPSSVSPRPQWARPQSLDMRRLNTTFLHRLRAPGTSQLRVRLGRQLCPLKIRRSSRSIITQRHIASPIPLLPCETTVGEGQIVIQSRRDTTRSGQALHLIQQNEPALTIPEPILFLQLRTKSCQRLFPVHQPS